MIIHTLYFGAVTDAVGHSNSEIEANVGITVGEITERLKGEYSRLAEIKLLFALNQEYAQIRNAGGFDRFRIGLSSFDRSCRHE